MATNETTDDDGTGKRFLVKCDACSYERAADGREEATRLGIDHRRETGHDPIAVEVPPSIGAA
jgi:hypothetical protein